MEKRGKKNKTSKNTLRKEWMKTNLIWRHEKSNDHKNHSIMGAQRIQETNRKPIKIGVHSPW